mgnify:CR=1 FL=1
MQNVARNFASPGMNFSRKHQKIEKDAEKSEKDKKKDLFQCLLGVFFD